MLPFIMLAPFRRRRVMVPCLALLFLVWSAMGLASALPQPVTLPPQEGGRNVLIVVGSDGEKSYSLPEIEALGLYRVTTTTFWPEDDGTYEGVLLADLLADAGLADASAVRLLGRDGYSTIIPQEDWQRWSVLLASRRDGLPMGTRDKGPLRIIYPRDADPRLSELDYRLRWIWLIQTIEQVAP